MRLSHCFVSAALLAVVSTVQAKIERTVEKTFPVQVGGALTVLAEGGAIDIHTDPTAAVVRVVATQTIQADSDAEAAPLLEKLELEIAAHGNDVKATAHYPGKPAKSLFKRWPPVKVDFEITLPENFNVDVHTSGGDIDIGDLKGKVKAKTSGGDVDLGRIDGSVDVATSGGDIELEANLGPATLTTSGGDIEVKLSRAPLQISTSGGDITVDATNAELEASTSGGTVKAGVDGLLRDKISLRTSGGGVSLYVPTNLAFHLDGQTTGGSVKVKGLTLPPSEGKPSKSKVVADINGGGPEIKLRTTGGSVSVEARAPLVESSNR